MKILLAFLLMVMSVASKGQSVNQILVNPDSLKDTKLKHNPARLIAGQGQFKTTWIGVEREFRIVKNILNLGILADYGLPKGGGYYNFIGGIYLSPYLAVNRQLLHNYQNQDKGLFLFGKAGYAAYATIASSDAAVDYGPIFGAGADYLFFRNFGLTASYLFYSGDIKPSIIQGGINFSF